MLKVCLSNLRTVRYWDLELFEQVAVSPAESNGVKCVLFHHDGEVLFSASQDSLRVCPLVCCLSVSVCSFVSVFKMDLSLSLSCSGSLLGASCSTRLYPNLMGEGIRYQNVSRTTGKSLSFFSSSSSSLSPRL